MTQHPFEIVDVFGAEPLSGNPLAVVRCEREPDAETMLRITRWLNFSETTFLLPPGDDAADYRTRRDGRGRPDAAARERGVRFSASDRYRMAETCPWAGLGGERAARPRARSRRCARRHGNCCRNGGVNKFEQVTGPARTARRKGHRIAWGQPFASSARTFETRVSSHPSSWPSAPRRTRGATGSPLRTSTRRECASPGA